MPLVPIGVLGAGDLGPYWFQSLTPPSGSTYASFQEVATDDSGNLYSTGVLSSATTDESVVFKSSRFGKTLWSKKVGTVGTVVGGYGIGVDSNNNSYVAADQGTQILVYKHDSDGVLQWQRSLAGAGDDFSFNAYANAAGDVYVVGTSTSPTAGAVDTITAKYDTSGTLLWQKRWGGTGTDRPQAVIDDSSGNVYVCGLTGSLTAGGTDGFLIKYNSSGVLQWQRKLGGSQNDNALSVGVDSLGDVYIGGQFNTTSDALLAKYNSSGTIQWQRSLTGAGSEFVRDLIIDSDDKIVLTGGPTSANNAFFAKYDTSGNLVLQRELAVTSWNLEPLGVSQVNSSTYGFVGSMDFSTDVRAMAYALPADGSLAGTYTGGGFTVAYTAGSMTAGTPALTAGTYSFADNTSTLTAGTPSNTSVSTAYTTTRVRL